MASTLDSLRDRLALGLPPGFGLRDRIESDLPFLEALYAQVREEELRPVPWAPEKKQAFLSDQFRKQHAFYREQFVDARWWMLLHGAEAIGRVYIKPEDGGIGLVEISIVSDLRNHGLGAAVMQGLIDHADGNGLHISLHVEPYNPALRLYRRFGFKEIEAGGVYLFMRRPPASRTSIENDLVTGMLSIT